MPQNDPPRITLIARTAGVSRSWDDSVGADTRLVFVDSLAFVSHAIRRALDVDHEDVARVIVDRIGTPAQFLELLSSLPDHFLGDVLFIRAEGASFLSATGRGGGRLLYALTGSDVDFYLQTMRLVGKEVADPIARLSGE